uniref:Uncharacterized protein n=1 Tax=Chrysotila carterae TaxID=13221 RepID=A0A7S4EYX4_CHRCT
MAPWHGQDHRRGCLPPGNSSNWYASLSGRPSSEKRSVVPESFSRHQDRKSSYYALRASSRPASSSQRPFNGPPASRQMTPSLHKGHRRDSLPLGHLSHRHAQGTPSNPLGYPSFFSARSISSSGGRMGGLEERMQPEQSREPSDRARLETGSRKRAYDESFSGRSTSSEGRHYARNLEEEAAQTRRRRYLHHQRDDTPTASDPLPCSDLRHALHRRHGSQEKVQEMQHQGVTISLQQSFTGLPSAASASADDRLQTLLQLWVRKAQHSRCCPFSSGGLAELKQIDACKYKQIAFSWSLPLDPSDPSAKPLCKFNKTKKNQTRSLFLSALQDHADHAGGVDNEDVFDDDDDVRRAASCAHHFLAEILRTLTNKVAPAMRQAVPEQPFHEKIPWPPLLLVTRLPAGIEPPTAALATLLGGHKPSAQVRVPSGSLANTVVLLFGGDDECEAYESAKQLLARSSQPSESGAVRWLEEADLRTFEAEGSAQQLLTDLSTHKAERGGAVRVEWVLKAATERRLFDEKLRRRLEAERKHAQLEEEKNKLMLELDALRRNSKELEDAQYLAISQTKSLIQMKGREERKLLEDRYRNELEILELEKDKAITEVAKEQKKAAHLKRQLEKLRKCSASADRLERKAGELHEVRKAKMRLEKRVFDTKEAVKQLRKVLLFPRVDMSRGDFGAAQSALC